MLSLLKNLRISFSNKFRSIIVKKSVAIMDSSSLQNSCNKRKFDDQDPLNIKKQKIIKQLELFEKRKIPTKFIENISEEELDILQSVKSSCEDLEMIQKSTKIRLKYNISKKLMEDLNDSEYYIQNGLRYVYPYTYIYQASVKSRWVGRKLLEVMKSEFRDVPEDELKKRFESKRVVVNGNTVDTSYVLRNNDFLLNINHRHELPVLGASINIVHCDRDLLVVDKPPSIPIHPCGRFRHNSVTNILAKDYGYDELKVLHRLDRHVSGTLLIARNIGKANQLRELIINHQFQKEYVCRVLGQFPLGSDADDGFISVEQPLEVIHAKISIAVVFPDGKPSKTLFKRLSYNGKTSAVLCKPLHGRMHQIRVHLQYLGFPIVNDCLYNCDAFGPERGKGGRYGGKTLKQLSQDVNKQHNISHWLQDDADSAAFVHDIQKPGFQLNNSDANKEFLDDQEKQVTLAALRNYIDPKYQEIILDKRYEYDPTKHKTKEGCLDCSLKFYDPPLRRMFLYLHALRYSTKDMSFETRMPSWAEDSWPY